MIFSVVSIDMEGYTKKAARARTEPCEEVLGCVMSHLEDARDRQAASMVSRRWYEVDGLTRKHVTVAFCYTVSAEQLTRRFPRIESLTVKGKPRASMYNLFPDDWGGYAKPWIDHVSTSSECLKSLHLRRMVVSDDDLLTLVSARGHMLHTLKLERCSGFSTLGLLDVARHCRSLKILMLDDSSIIDEGGQWLHELAINNPSLEVLNFYSTQLQSISKEDLELLIERCQSLKSLRVSDVNIFHLLDVVHKAKTLEEFGGGQFPSTEEEGEKSRKDGIISFPPKLTSLSGFNFMIGVNLPIMYPIASALKRVDLQFTLLTTENHCQFLELCPNLEILEVTNVIGDKGMEVVSKHCKKLRRLRVESGPDEGGVSHQGLSIVAQGCPLLEYIAIYVSDMCNSCLETIGESCKNLKDFRLVLLDKEANITDLPLDRGVKALLKGCTKLNRFAFYVRPGALTDKGLYYIGKYSYNIRWMLLGFVGLTDQGILEFSKGCPKLERLEIRGCCFSEAALAIAVAQLRSLKYLWVQGFNEGFNTFSLMPMQRPYWNIEFLPGSSMLEDDAGIEAEGDAVTTVEVPQLLAYYSLTGMRADIPNSVIPLSPPPFWVFQEAGLF